LAARRLPSSSKAFCPRRKTRSSRDSARPAHRICRQPRDEPLLVQGLSGHTHAASLQVLHLPEPQRRSPRSIPDSTPQSLSRNPSRPDPPLLPSLLQIILAFYRLLAYGRDEGFHSWLLFPGDSDGNGH